MVLPAAAQGTPSRSDPTSVRVPYVDSLRGLASMWVMLHHSWAASMVSLGFSANVRFTPARLLFGGRLPVILFFVLSGFVLALPYVRGNAPSYISFMIKRVCRIYLPFATVVLGSAAFGAVAWAGSISGATALINDMWIDVTGKLVLEHLLMTGIVGQTNLDAPIWSLVQELRISICFPALVLICLRVSSLWALGLGCSLFLTCWAFLYWAGQDAVGYYAAASLFTTIPLTIYFILPFIVGILTAKHYHQLVSAMHRLPRFRAFLWCAAGATVCAPSFSPGVDAVYALGTAVILILVPTSPIALAVLERNSILWLGRISYSMYLVHVPVLGALGCLLSSLPFVWVAAVAPAISLVVADVTYRMIEAPAMQLGRSLARSRIGSRQGPGLRVAPKL